MAELIEIPFEMLSRVGPRNHVLDGDTDPPWEGQFLGEGHAPTCPITFCSQLCKWLKRSICHLGCGLGWAEGSTRSIVFARCRHVPSWEGTLAPPGEYD